MTAAHPPIGKTKKAPRGGLCACHEARGCARVRQLGPGARVVMPSSPLSPACQGTTAALLIANSLNSKSNTGFHSEVRMWVFEELVNGAKLSELINGLHENPRYLAGVKLPHNVVAVTDAVEAARDCTHLVFVLPHQFLDRLCSNLAQAGVVRKGAVAISLIKGITFDKNGPRLVSDSIQRALGIPCGVLMGANVADEGAWALLVAAPSQSQRAQWREASSQRPPSGCVTSALRALARTGCSCSTTKFPFVARCEQLCPQRVVDAVCLSLQVRNAVAAVEVMGALKNVVGERCRCYYFHDALSDTAALAAGIAEGLQVGSSIAAPRGKTNLFAPVREQLQGCADAHRLHVSLAAGHLSSLFDPALQRNEEVRGALLPGRRRRHLLGELRHRRSGDHMVRRQRVKEPRSTRRTATEAATSSALPSSPRRGARSRCPSERARIASAASSECFVGAGD